MKDLFQNYHKHKVLSNIGVLSVSAILAVSVNMFLLSGNTGESLKASVIEASTNQGNSVDFIAENTPESIIFKNGQEIQNVTEFSFSLAYNYEILELGESISSLDGVNISVIENNDGFSTYIITFQSPLNLAENTNIINLAYSKTAQDTVHLNIVNVNFTDTQGEKYLLSTESIIF